MIATLIFFGLLFLYIFIGIFSTHRQSLDLYGENSMLKVPRTYRAAFFSQSDLFYWLFILMSIVVFLLSFNIQNDLAAQIFVVLIALALLSLSSLYFWIKYQYWKKNGNQIFIFDPVSRKLTIEGYEITEISFDEIQEFIIYYPINYKLVSVGYIKIILDNKTAIYLTSLLPCYAILEEFFVGVKKQHIHKRIFSLN
jgi:hypothetical protein